MRINNNLMAMNTHRQLGINNMAGQKSIEKLSSGYRINRAGDDAAGLSISEKMRAQIRGLNQASRNSQDGISLIQTAEGALQETQAILQRMRELAVQAANDTNVETDRGEIQKEINQLTSEINRIGNTTEFNTMKLLNSDRAAGGSVSTKVSIVAAMAAKDLSFAEGVTLTNIVKAPTIKGGAAFSANNTITIDKTAEGWKETSAAGTITIEKIAGDKLQVSLTTTASSGKTINVVDKLSINDDGNFEYNAHGVKFQISGDDYRAMGDAGAKIALDVTQTEIAAGKKSTANDFVTNASTSGAATVTGFTVAKDNNWENMDSMNFKWSAGEATVTITNTDGTIITDKYKVSAGGTLDYEDHGVTFKFTANALSSGVEFNHTFDKEDKTVTTTVEDKSLSFQVGANENQAMMLDISDMRAAALGITSTEAKAGFALSKAVTNGTNNSPAEYALDVSTHKAAAASVTTIDNAINTVSSERSKLGAVQNRLEHTIKNLDTSAENLQASESRIRDVDMAKEMMEFTKNNILQQAATAMLAQANQAPQGVLQLLR